MAHLCSQKDTYVSFLVLVRRNADQEQVCIIPSQFPPWSSLHKETQLADATSFSGTVGACEVLVGRMASQLQLGRMRPVWCPILAGAIGRE